MTGLIECLEKGIIDIIQQQFGLRPRLTAPQAIQLALNRFDFING